MRKVYYAPWPHDADLIAAAQAAGASEILDGEGGIAVIEEPGDSIEGRLAMLADQRNTAAQATTWRGYTAPCDTAACTNVNGAILAAQMGGPATRTWKMGPGVTAELATADLVDLGLTMAAHVQACFDHEAAIAAQIIAAPDVESRLAIDIAAGWPI